MLHGNSGSNEEWLAYGLVDDADEMITNHEIRPMIIVLPQGDYSYWVNLVDGPAYGDYLTIDLVQHINAPIGCCQVRTARPSEACRWVERER